MRLPNALGKSHMSAAVISACELQGESNDVSLGFWGLGRPVLRRVVGGVFGPSRDAPRCSQSPEEKCRPAYGEGRVRGLSEIVVGWMHWSTEAGRARHARGNADRVVLHENHARARSEHVGVRVAKGVG